MISIISNRDNGRHGAFTTEDNGEAAGTASIVNDVPLRNDTTDEDTPLLSDPYFEIQ